MLERRTFLMALVGGVAAAATLGPGQAQAAPAQLAPAPRYARAAEEAVDLVDGGDGGPIEMQWGWRRRRWRRWRRWGGPPRWRRWGGPPPWRRRRWGWGPPPWRRRRCFVNPWGNVVCRW